MNDKMNNHFYNNNNISESSFDLNSIYQVRHKNYFSITNRNKKKIKIGILNSSYHNNSEEKNYFSQRNSISSNLTNYPIVITENSLKKEKKSENNLIQKVNNYYIDSSLINLDPSNYRKNILYKNKSDLFFEKLEKKKNKKTKIPFNQSSKIKFTNSLINHLNIFKNNNTENTVKNSISNTLIKNKINKSNKIYTIFQKNNKEFPIIQFNEVLLNIFRIIEFYNNKNEYLKEEKVICKIQDELTEYYEEKINTKLKENEKTKIKGFSNEIFHIFKNKNNLIKKYEKIIKKDNGDKKLKLQEIFKDSYAKNKINDTINNFYSLKEYKAGKIFSKKNNYEKVSSILVEKFNKSLSPQNKTFDKKKKFNIQKTKIFGNNKKEVNNNNNSFHSFSNNKQSNINTIYKRNNLLTSNNIYNKKNLFEKKFLKTENYFSNIEKNNLLNIRNNSDDKNFKQLENNSNNKYRGIETNSFEKLTDENKDIIKISNLNNITNFQNSDLKSKNENTDSMKDKIKDEINLKNDKNSNINENENIIYNDSCNFNQFLNSKNNKTNFSDNIDTNHNILHTQLSSLQKTESSIFKNIEDQNDKINNQELLIHFAPKSLNKNRKNFFNKKVTKFVEKNKISKSENKEKNKLKNKKQLKLNTDIESIKPINSFNKNIISDKENNIIQNEKNSFISIKLSNIIDDNNYNYNQNKSILKKNNIEKTNELRLKNKLKENENKEEKKEEDKKENNLNKTENEDINEEKLIEKQLKKFPISFHNEDEFKDETFSYNSLNDESMINEENNFRFPYKKKNLSSLIKEINKESNKINNINKQKTKGKLLGNNLKELRLNNTTNSIENEKIEQEKNKIKNNLQLLDEKKISYKKETYELMLKLKNDLAFYLSQDKWDIIEKKKLNEFKKKIEKIQHTNIEDYINEILDMNEEIKEWKAVREIERRINGFKEKLNEQISYDRLRREKLQNSFNLIDNIF